MRAILLRPDESRLIRHLSLLIKEVLLKLSEPEAWEGFVLRDTDNNASYHRLVCADRIISKADGSIYRLAIHRFPPEGTRTSLHNHRFPFAVLPLAESGEPGVELYRMPWEWREDERVRDGGTVVVTSGCPYAIEAHVEVFHAVESIVPHWSVVLADITRLPSRQDRLASIEMSGEEVRLTRRRTAEMLVRYMDRSSRL